KSWDEFDMIPIVEHRKNWAFQNQGRVDELLERIDSFLKIGDFVTACLLLDRLGTQRGDRQPEITEVMIGAVRQAVKSGNQSAIEGALEILCRIINFDKKPYGENVRVFFKEFFEKYHTFFQLRFLGERGPKWMSMILLNIGHAGDKSFIPILENLSLDNKEVAYFFEYTSVCQEMIKMEGLKMLVLQHLKNLEENS
ncbi:hypothetical protein KJ751_02220, partial [Patescibacteria group bacterium]|nr:hypothetical protein [Patescibacteria group bacterium]